MDAFGVVRDFEKAIAEYTGAPHVVAVNSCTMALFLSLLWYRKCGGEYVTIPSCTYPSVPMAAKQANLRIDWRDYKWCGGYRLTPSKVWDFAKRLTSGMYKKGAMQCVSFHARKLLPIGQGGAILHDNEQADEWFRRMRFDGRKEGIPTSEDTFEEAGYHCYMLPEHAARGLHLMTWYPKDVPDQPMDNYPYLPDKPMRLIE